jgi:hypothetical protein
MGQWMDTWTKVDPTSFGIQPMKKLGQMGLGKLTKIW